MQVRAISLTNIFQGMYDSALIETSRYLIGVMTRNIPEVSSRRAAV